MTPQQAGCPAKTAAPTTSGRWTGSGGNTTYDARSKTFAQTQQNLYPVWLEGQNNCFQGGVIQGQISKADNWWQLKQCCNGAGIMVDGASKLLGVRIDNLAVDAIRIRKHAATTIDDMYASYTRDDCISDITHADLVIDDSLFDGCHTGISWRSHNSKIVNQPFKLQVTNSLFYIQPMAGNASGGSCKNWVVNGQANGPMWKMEGNAERVNLQNVVIRQDLANHECGEAWPAGTYNNVTFVWTSSKPYPGKLPAGVKLTNDVSVWNNAKSQWLAAHDGSPSGNPSPQPSPTTSPTPQPSPTTSPTPQPTPTKTPNGHVSKLLVIWEENHSLSQMESGMPYLASMSKTYGYTTNYKAIGHPSLPNYLAFIAGSNMGVTDDNPPVDHHLTGTTLFSQALAAGKTAKTYSENEMNSSGTPTNCETQDITSPTGYEVHHNPWTYFTDDTTNCKNLDVPFPGNTSGGAVIGGALAHDASTSLPDFSYVEPNECNDAHDCGLSTADNWLKAWLPTIMKGPDYQAGRLGIVITADEDDRKGNNTVLTTVISPYTHSVVSNTAYTHYSLTRLVDEVLGLPAIRNAASANSMRAAFAL
jgi:acid phosphatase